MWVAETSSTSYEGRASLARRATELARAAMPGVDVEILWDGMWVRRVGPDYFPDPDMFRLAGTNAAPNWERWAGQARKHLRDAEDYWFYVYKPRAGDAIVDIGAGAGRMCSHSLARWGRPGASGLSSRIRSRLRRCAGFANSTGCRM